MRDDDPVSWLHTMLFEQRRSVLAFEFTLRLRGRSFSAARLWAAVPGRRQASNDPGGGGDPGEMAGNPLIFKHF